MFKKPFFPERDDLFYPFQSFLDKVYDELTTSNGASTIKAKSGYPRWDVYEKDNSYIVEIAVPGLSKDDIQVEILPDLNTPDTRILKISGRMDQCFQSNDSQTKYYTRELRRSTFERYWQLPDYVKGDPVAMLTYGILTLQWTIEKPSKNKRITINIVDGNKKSLENGPKPP